MKVLITGATGFIGSHLVKFLLSKGIKIVIVKHPDDNSLIPKDVTAFTFDYNSKNDIDFMKNQNIDAVIHLASLFLSSHTSNDIKPLIETNIFFSTYTLECSVKSDIKCFLNTGTFWQHYQNAEYSPANLYAATKEAFQVLAQYYIQTNQIHFNTLKLSDTYGPDDTRPKILNLFEKISRTGEQLDMSPGEQIIDISYIDDIVAAYYRLLLLLRDQKTENGAAFAVKAKERYTLKELALKYEEVTGKKLNIKWGGRPYREREIMIPWENGISVPGWEPLVSIHDGIRKTRKLNTKSTN